jgi:dTDP-D-glucose 4,6-dehydratase
MKNILVTGGCGFIGSNFIRYLFAGGAAGYGAEGGCLFHHVSTDEVYGSLGAEGYFYETTPYDPRSPYSASKASSNHLVMSYYNTYGLPVTMSNCTNNYGPYQFPEKLIPFVKDRPGHDRRCAINCDKIKEELGWKRRYSFEEGLEQTVRWYLDNTEWAESIRTGAYKEWTERNYGERG